jgi:tetratricopeptide (TPR) repeat protein
MYSTQRLSQNPFKMLFLRLLFLFLMLAVVQPKASWGQANTDYLQAMQFMQQNRFEQAYEIFAVMMRRDPANYPVFDQAVNALVQMKRYEEAIDLASRRLGRNDSNIVLATRLGELYHLNDQTEAAFDIWNRTLRANEGALEAYRFVAETMANRREFTAAIEIYERARTRFGNNTLYFSELTSAWMALGNFEKGVETLLSVLTVAPGNSTFVQRQIINYDDSRVTEAAIVQLEDLTRAALPADPAYGAYREVMISLLMEQRLFRRALSTARSYETFAREGVWPVYALGNRLRSQRQYQLADEAYLYYADRSGHPLRARSMEDRALLYVSWSRDLTAQNLDYDGKAADLYHQADVILRELLETVPDYNRRQEVLVLKAEIALDYHKNSDMAEEYLNEIRRRPGNATSAILADYLQGRIYMSRGQHSVARLSLTRANREARTGELAEKSRYFLALNDFYNGDFEFAAIQMRPLERLSTSFYANDALQLRLWMQEGQRAGETFEELKIYSRARYLFDTGKAADAIEIILPIVSADTERPMRGESVLMTADYLRTVAPDLTYDILSQVLSTGFRGAQRERLLWERVRIADGVRHSTLVEQPDSEIPQKLMSLEQWVSRNLLPANRLNADDVSSELIFRLYEDLLFEFPMGYYAEAARARLQELQTRIPS